MPGPGRDAHLFTTLFATGAKGVGITNGSVNGLRIKGLVGKASITPCPAHARFTVPAASAKAARLPKAVSPAMPDNLRRSLRLSLGWCGMFIIVPHFSVRLLPGVSGRFDGARPPG